MAYNPDLKIATGDEFLDLEKRYRGLRVVRIVNNPPENALPGDRVLVKTVAAPPENPKAIGRHSEISIQRLRESKQYKKVSR